MNQTGPRRAEMPNAALGSGVQLVDRVQMIPLTVAALLGLSGTSAPLVIDEVGGRLVRTTGDGELAMFDGTAKAIRAVCAIRAALNDIGIVIPAGVHTVEVERRDAHIARSRCARRRQG
jgi:class 3 adenylate cyclase